MERLDRGRRCGEVVEVHCQRRARCEGLQRLGSVGAHGDVDGRCRIDSAGKAECMRGTFFADHARTGGPQIDSWWLELMDHIDQSYRTMGETMVDTWFGAVAGEDFLPDVAVGRFSVRQPEGAAQIVQKIIEYESTPLTDTATWARTVLHISGISEPLVGIWTMRVSNEATMSARSLRRKGSPPLISSHISGSESAPSPLR